MPEYTAQFRFYEELNDFLPPSDRKRDIDYAFDGRPAVKAAIEAMGVPHTEVDLIVINGRSTGFDHLLSDGDRVAVYPSFEALDITPIVKLRDRPLRRTAFVLDVHLGKLARLLRLLGFDAAYRNDYADEDLARVSASEHRVLLTRDRRLLFRRAVTHGYCVRSPQPAEQAAEVLRRFDLASQVRPFQRCCECNGLLAPVAKEAILDRLQPLTRRYHDRFSQCAGCGRIYWPGSHYERLARRLAAIAEARTHW